MIRRKNMLHRQRTIVPKIITTQDELIDAMKQKEIVIYIVGNYAKEVKKKLKDTKLMRFVNGTGKFGLVLFPALAILGGPIGWGAIALSAGTAALGKMGDDFKNYSFEIKNKDTDPVIILKRVKGPDKFNAADDIIAR